MGATEIENYLATLASHVSAYDAVLFDNDGILIEPPVADRQLAAARQAFVEYGIDAVDDDHVAAIGSGTSHEKLQDVCTELDLDPVRLWELRDQHDRRYQQEDIATGHRSGYDDVDAIAECNVDRAVVSNNHHAIVEVVLDHLGIDHLFETYYGRERSIDGLRRKKPDPHYIERALDDLGAETGLYVGDKVTDVIAAQRAGLDAVFVRRAHCRDVALETTPEYEIETLQELPRLLEDRRN